MKHIQLVPTMDILPSALDVVGCALPEGIDGKSLVTLFGENKKDSIHDHLIWAGIHASKWEY